VHEGQNYVIDRAHCGFPEMDFHPRVILLIRDYRECLIRHHQRNWHPQDDVSAFLEDKEVDQSPTWYVNNIIAFDNFRGPKTAIYYEDEILNNPSASANKVAQFLSIGSNGSSSFTDNIQQHVRRSIGLYKSGGHSSTTPKRKDPMHHARSHLTPDQIRAFDEYYSTKYPLVFSKYLNRYDTR